MSRIFLSHSSRDTREAVALKTWLVEQTPPLANEIFLDVDQHSGLRTGTRWKDALRRANARCEAVICLLSPNWEQSHECKVEYRTAENLNKQIFCARLEPSTGDDLTSEWQRCDLFGDGPKTRIDTGDGGPPVEFATEGLYRLRDGIRGAGIGAESFVWPPPSDPDRAPYRGWEPLDEADAAVFFGRDAQIVRALDAIRGMRLSAVNSLFVVLGPSGTGKSSFLRAGLLPRLRREDRRFVIIDIVRPERDVLSGDRGFASALYVTRAGFGLSAPSRGEIRSACEAGDADQVSLWLNEIRQSAANRLLQRGGIGDAAAPTLVLPLDQAEELFAADATDAAERFLALLREVLTTVNSADLGLVVAATIRTDRYEILQTHPHLDGLGTELFDELKPMPRTQFKEVIVGPAQRATDGGKPLRIAPDLVERLLADAGEGADTLPMLALTLARLYTDYGSTGELTLRHYDGMGGMRRIVQTEVDDVLSRDTATREEQLRALRSAFIPWLATVNPDNGQPMRRVASESDLPDESRALIDALVAKRLMVRDVRGATPVVEVALESLLRQWDDLAGWLREERKDLSDADDLVRSAEAWHSSDRNPSWLLEGTRLAEATTLVNRPGFRQRLVGVHGFLDASQQREMQRREEEEIRRQNELLAAQEREQAAQERARHAQEQQAMAEKHAATLRRRGHVLRIAVAVTAVLAVVAAVAFVRADSASQEATRQFHEATSQRLTIDAQAILDGSRPGGDIRALQQLVAGQRLTQRQDRDALYDAAVATAGLVRIMQTSAEVVSVAISPDGRLVATGGDGKVWLWDLENGDLLGEPMSGHEGAVGSLAFNSDGTLLASGADDSTIRIWEVATRQQKGKTINVDGSEGVLVRNFADSDTRLVFQTSNDVVWSWAVDGSAKPERVFPGGVERIAVSPSRNRVATSEGDVIKIWDTRTSSQIGGDIVAHDEVFSLAFNHDGSRLASGGQDKSVRLWDAATGLPVGAPMTANSAELVWLEFPPDSSYLAAAAADGTVRFYDALTQTPLGAPLQAVDGFPQGLEIDRSGRRMVIGGTDRTVRIYDVGLVVPLTGQTSAFNADGSLLVTGGRDGALRRINRETGRSDILDGRMGELMRLAFLPDGNRMVAADAAGTVQVWDIEAGRPTGEPMPGNGQPVYSLSISHTGSQVIAGYADGAVRVWDLARSRLVRPEWRPATGGVPAVGFLADDSQVFAVVLDGMAKFHVWDMGSGKEVDQRDIGGDLFVAFGPDGRVLGGRLDGNVTFMTGLDGEAVAEPTRAHGDAVVGVAFSPDGHRAATSARDGSIRMWDADAAITVGEPFSVSPSMAPILVFSADGKTLATGGDDNTTRLWPTGASIEDLCAKLSANMSREQWRDWVSPDIDYVAACPDLPVPPD